VYLRPAPYRLSPQKLYHFPCFRLHTQQLSRLGDQKMHSRTENATKIAKNVPDSADIELGAVRRNAAKLLELHEALSPHVG
jgi:hypothetical protein